MDSLTKRCFYETPYQKELKTTVKENIKIKKNYGIILEETIFYPEGGGQPGDTGKINKFPVLNTIIHDGKICHIVPVPIEIGSKVKLQLDWQRRYEFMQAHSAQHLISSILEEKYRIETLSLHLGENTTSIDVTKPNLTWKFMNQLENEVNQLIFENRPVKIQWYNTEEELDKIPLRKHPKKRDKKGIRIVSIEDKDNSPCGGVHIRNTGELGLIKFVKSTNITEGTRLEYLCGWRSLEFFQKITTQISNTAIFLNVQIQETEEAVKKQVHDKLEALEKIKELEEKLSKYQQEDIKNQGEPIGSANLYTHIFSASNMNQMRDIANEILKSTPKVVILFGNIKEEKASLLFACDPGLTTENLNMSDLIEQTAQKLGGNGGGRPQFAQGGGNAENFQSVFETTIEKVKNILI